MNRLSRRSCIKGILAGGLGSGLVPAIANSAPNTSIQDKRATIKQLQGVYNFLTTPFHADYELDAAGLQRNVAFHADAEPQDMVIVVAGGLGELFTLDVQEHEKLVEAAVAGAGGKVPVVAGAGGGYKHALAMAKNVEEAGADGVLVFAYPFACRSSEGAYSYLGEIARSVRIPSLIYTCGEGDFWADILKRLAKLPNVIGFKDPSGDIKVGRALGELIPDDFLWIAEGEGHAEKALPAGARAYTTAVGTFVPKACHEFWQCGINGQIQRMKHVRKARIDPIVALRGVKPGYGISAIKVALEALGRAGGPVRPPGVQVEPQDRGKISAIARKHAENR